LEDEVAFPFNVTECIEAAERLVEGVDTLRDDHNNNASIPILFDDVTAIIVDVEFLLGNCGEASIEEEIEKILSPECLNSLDQLVADGYDILEHDKNIPYVLSHIGKFLKDIENSLSICNI
jgi:hypothetical protein